MCVCVCARYDEDVYERHYSGSRRMLNALVTHLRTYEDEERAQVSELIHGDPVFTNLLLTPSSNIVMLDMRGCLGSTLTVRLALSSAGAQRLGLTLSVL